MKKFFILLLIPIAAGAAGFPFSFWNNPQKIYATLNPSDKSSCGVLSNGNLTLTANSAAWCVSRGTFSKSSGKWYWEVTIGVHDPDNNGIIIGVSTGGSLPGGPGSYTNGFGYNDNGRNVSGRRFDGANIAPYGSSYSSGDVIGVAVDIDAGSIAFYKNGSSPGNAYNTGVTGTIFPVVTVYGNDAVTANFGQNSFSFTPPSGFTPGFFQ